jgi:DNA-binding GntR family transcriptional regulator
MFRTSSHQTAPLRGHGLDPAMLPAPAVPPLTGMSFCGILVIYHGYTPRTIQFPGKRRCRSHHRGVWASFGLTQNSERFPRVRLSEKAYRLIKEKIVTLELPPSALIDEHSLMQELGLGRTPIREALQRLDCEGLVNIIPRRGTFVSDISFTDLPKIFELRASLEGFCARLAARRITDGQIEKMESVLRELEAVQGEDHQPLMSVDERLHKLLYRAADNEFLAETLDRLYDLSLRLWHLVFYRLHDVRHSIEQHRRIFAALKEGNEDEAEALVRQHIVEFQHSIRETL